MADVRFERVGPGAWLALTTAIIVLAFIGSTLYASGTARRLDSMVAGISANAVPSIRHLSAARTELHAISDLIAGAFAGGQATRVPRDALVSHEQRMRVELDAYKGLPYFTSERTRWANLDAGVREAEQRADELLADLEAGDARAAADIRSPFLAAKDRADLALAQLIGFDADQSAQLAHEIRATRDRSERATAVVDGLAVALAIAMLFGAGQSYRQHTRMLEERGEAEARMTAKLQAVAQAGIDIAGRVSRADSLKDVLQATVDSARTVAGASMGALGIGADPSRPFDPFVVAGVEPSLLKRLGGAPPLRGVLATPLEQQHTVRLDDVRTDPHFRGVPEGHPPVGPFLGVLVRSDGAALGQLYLARPPGARLFTEQDAHAVELLATFAGTAAQNASLYGALRREVAAREDLLSMVSHDLRNPLSALRLAAEALRRELPASSTARPRMEVILRNASRMERLIGDLLTAAKVHAGRLTIEAAPQAVLPLVSEVVDDFAAQAGERGVRLSIEVLPDLPPVDCDRARVIQVLSNLLSNALKFTPRGGSIVVSARAEATDVRFSVRDTGVGLAEDACAHVFDRFWQAGDHAARGTGLGLYIAKGIVEAHRGCIGVVSCPGKGAEFYFTLPRCNAQRDARVDASRRAPSPPDGR